MREYTADELQALSLPIVRHLLRHELILRSDTLLLYYSLPTEVFTHHAIDLLHKQGKRILLPKVVSDTEMVLCEYSGAGSLTRGAFGIMEPSLPHSILQSSSAFNPPVIVVPGIAFDAEGNRLGRGKGYYDRLLSSLPQAYKIGLCFPFQLLDEVPHDAYDVAMNEIIWQ